MATYLYYIYHFWHSASGHIFVLQGRLYITNNSTVFKDGPCTVSNQRLNVWLSNQINVSNQLSYQINVSTSGYRLGNAGSSRLKHILQWRYYTAMKYQLIIMIIITRALCWTISSRKSLKKIFFSRGPIEGTVEIHFF